MPAGVSRGDFDLAYVHSQMNPQTWTKVGANRSSRLTASPDFWMFDPLKPQVPPLCLEQGWGRLQKPDYDYDYSAHTIIDYDYDYSGDWKGDYDYDYNHPITITVTCLPWKRF